MFALFALARPERESVHDNRLLFLLTILLSAVIQCFVAQPQVGVIGGERMVYRMASPARSASVDVKGDVRVGRDATIIVSAYTERLRSAAISKPTAMPIRTFVQPGAFDPQAIAAMTEAFDAACEKLGDIDQPEVAREVIATRIIAAARLGERDPTRLLAAALRKPARPPRGHRKAAERSAAPGCYLST